MNSGVPAPRTTGARCSDSVSTSPATERRSDGRAAAHEDDVEVLAAVRRCGLGAFPGGGDGVGQPGGDERPVEVGEAHRLRWRARHDDERRLADLARAVADLVVPAARSVDDVEEPAAEDDGPRTRGRLATRSGDPRDRRRTPRCAGRPPPSPRPLSRPGFGPGDEAVEGDRDVRDDPSHARADLIGRPNSSQGAKVPTTTVAPTRRPRPRVRPDRRHAPGPWRPVPAPRWSRTAATRREPATRALRRRPAGRRPARPARRRAPCAARGRVPRAASGRSPRSARRGRWRRARPPVPAGREGVGRTGRPRTRVRRRRRCCGGRTPRRPDRGPRRAARRRTSSAATSQTDRAGAAAEVEPPRRPGGPGRWPAAARKPVRRRGTNTPGSIATRSPRNSAQPSRCSSGSPADAAVHQGSSARRGPPSSRAAAAPRPRRTRTRRHADARRRRRTGADRSRPGDATPSS